MRMLILALSLLLVCAACQSAADTPTSTTIGTSVDQSGGTLPLGAGSTATSEPAVTSTTSAGESPPLSGGFVIDNTSEGGATVLVETMTLGFDVVQSSGTPAVNLEADCTLDPEAPVTVEEELQVSYECTLLEAPPEGSEIRGAVEVTIAGSDEVYTIAITVD